MAQGSDAPTPPLNHHRRVIVAGYGPVGRVVADQLQAAGAQVVIIDMNARTVARQQALGMTALVGDVADPQVLREAGIEQADALILAIPNDEAVLRACHAARQLAPHIFVAARTNHLSKGMQCRNAGADAVIVEEVITAQAMGQTVMDALKPNADGRL
jgi:Trk K+ transport system NAD-binding subunit